MSPKTPDFAEAIALIQDHAKTMRFCVKQQSRLDRALHSLVAVRFFGYEPVKREKGTAPDAKAKAIFTAAAKRIEEAQSNPDDPLHGIAVATELSRAPFDKELAAAKLQMKKLVRGLPVWDAWAKDVRGLGEISLGTIIGETGDLSKYATVSKVWKRLGLAVIAGHRQGAPGKGASAEDWIAEGYNPARRSVVWMMASSLFRAQPTTGDEGDAGPYRAIYDARKSYELERGIALGHAHNRAMRYMSKCVIADLWSAWREARTRLEPITRLPLSDSLPDEPQGTSEGKASVRVKPKKGLPSLEIPQDEGPAEGAAGKTLKPTDLVRRPKITDEKEARTSLSPTLAVPQNHSENVATIGSKPGVAMRRSEIPAELKDGAELTANAAMNPKTHVPSVEIRE